MPLGHVFYASFFSCLFYLDHKMFRERIALPCMHSIPSTHLNLFMMTVDQYVGLVLCLQQPARGCTALSTRVLLLDEVPTNHNRARNKTIFNLDFKRSGFDNAFLYIHSNETTNTSEIVQTPHLHKIRCSPFPPCQNFSEEGNLCALGSLAVNALSYSSTCVIAWCLQSQLINMCMHYLLPGWLEKHFLAWYVFLLHLQWLPASRSFSKYYIY